MMSLRSSCEALLHQNDRGRYTIPAAHLYPHQWAWDSAFAAIGWAHINPRRAWVELETLMQGQWLDGRVPHIAFHTSSNDYFPTPRDWGTDGSSTITQPPIWATAARRVLEVTGDSGPLDGLIPRFEASHAFFHAQRDPMSLNAVAVVHPWESGLDNCPAWDAPLSRVDAAAAPQFQRKDKNVVDASMRPSDAEYARYMALVAAIAADDFGPGGFAVYDPFMTAVLARAEDDLGWLAQQMGYASEARRRAQTLREGLVNALWSDALGRFIYLDAATRDVIETDVIGAYLPLWCGLPESYAERLQAGLRQRFWTAYPLPSTAPVARGFDPRRYWRGPTWVNVNWLLSESLGPEPMDAATALVAREGFREYYNPHTGAGLGAKAFTWSAALVLDWIARKQGPVA